MGLLDDLLGQLAGGAARPDAGVSTQRAPTASSAGMGPALIALLPIVIALLRGRGGGQPEARSAQSGGGLGDLLGQILGGGRAASGGGGLGDLLEQFQRAGYGDQARSWVGTGQNQPLPPDALEQIFGRGGLAEIARRAGLSEQETSRGLSQLMPEVVDRMTPTGEVPDPNALLASVDDLARRLGVS